jgi:hypothetical protein
MQFTSKTLAIGGVGGIITGFLFEIGAKIADVFLSSASAISVSDYLTFAGYMLLVAGILAVAIAVYRIRRNNRRGDSVTSTAERQGALDLNHFDFDKLPKAGVTTIESDRPEVENVVVPKGYTGHLDIRSKKPKSKNVRVEGEDGQANTGPEGEES